MTISFKFAEGDRIVITEHMPVPPNDRPWLTLPPGEAGEIADVDPETGDVLIRLDRYFERLAHWRNMIFVRAYQLSAISLA